MTKKVPFDPEGTDEPVCSVLVCCLLVCDILNLMDTQGD